MLLSSRDALIRRPHKGVFEFKLFCLMKELRVSRLETGHPLSI